MLIKKLNPSTPANSEITPRVLVDQRRVVMKAMAAGLSTVPTSWLHAQTNNPASKLITKPGPFPLLEKPTPYKDVTTYNNYYEFGTDKDEPAKNAQTLKTRPWQIVIEGAVAKPMTIGIEELLKLAPLEDRVYRMRCVEGWSMVIPWIGYSLSELIKKVEPTSNAKFVEFITLNDKTQMPGVRSPVLQWPYVEGLRIDEAMNPLTLLTVGLYGEVLPNQNGAPVRLVVPWKYGFKSGKSLVKIRFTDKQPITSWNRSAPSEYGFFSNVNPEVDHPRWTQASERRIGEDGFLQKKRKTLMFNGYAEQVASLYQGMNLSRFF